MSGPSSILSGDVYVAGHDFKVPLCAFSPCNFAGQTTLGAYVRSANFIEVVLYEDTSASAGVVLAATTNTPWGPNLTDPIATAAVIDQGVDIVIQPPGSYYTLYAEATVATVTVSVPEPSTWAMMILGFAGLGLAGSRKSGRRALVTHGDGPGRAANKQL